MFKENNNKMKYIQIYEANIKPNILDGSYVTLNADTVIKHWISPRMDSAADGNRIQELDSRTGIRNTWIETEDRKTESSSANNYRRRELDPCDSPGFILNVTYMEWNSLLIILGSPEVPAPPHSCHFFLAYCTHVWNIRFRRKKKQTHQTLVAALNIKHYHLQKKTLQRKYVVNFRKCCHSEENGLKSKITKQNWLFSSSN